MNLEPIIQAKLKRFKNQFDCETKSDPEVFEIFVNSAILSAHYPEAFNADLQLLKNSCIGGCNDLGIDGIGIKVNGVLVKDDDEIEELVSRDRTAKIEFIFIQSKYKNKFSTQEFRTFIDGIRDFFRDEPLQPYNDGIKYLHQLRHRLYQEDILYEWECNPIIHVYYVTLGSNETPLPHIEATSRQFIDDIKKDLYIDDIKIHLVDAKLLKSICDSNENKFSIAIDSIETMPLNSVDSVENSCLLLCWGNEVIKMLETEDDMIRKSLFEGNVRDFYGLNNINSEIKETIDLDPSTFALLNNGLTIVCDKYIPNNRKITIHNPQIVNGCQTSHVLYSAYKNNLGIAKVPIIIKLIATKDIEITNKIVRGTNRQNIVYNEAFEATREWHRELENFFNSMYTNLKYHRVYYERRSKQYNHNSSIKTTQKINFKILIQSFIGMFLNSPQKSYIHESKLLTEFSNQIFKNNQSKLPYFTSSLAFYELEKLFRDDILDRKKFYPYRYHILMLLREKISGSKPSINNEKEIDKHSQKVLDCLSNEQDRISAFKMAIEAFEKAKSDWKGSPYGIKDNQKFTTLLLEVSSKNQHGSSSRKLQEETGKVLSVKKDVSGQEYGFIHRYPDNIFFHSTHNKNIIFSNLENKNVTYSITKNPYRNNSDMAIITEILD